MSSGSMTSVSESAHDLRNKKLASKSKIDSEEFEQRLLEVIKEYPKKVRFRTLLNYLKVSNGH